MYLWSILLFLSSSLHAADPDLKVLAQSEKWLKLLHYKNGKSEVDGKDFFLHPKGHLDPLAEIAANVAAFSSENNPDNNHPICKFPLRFKWLNHQLGNSWKINWNGCGHYLAFFEKLAASRASVVFSSYYLSNPNSAFGHTFLRLSRYADSDETEMLDYGINFAADSRTNSPFSYMYQGLTGGFRGAFSAIPYYYKVREYSDFEFRDIWSYDLKLDIGQVFEIVDHTWELGHTYFDYYYLHENCSYHILALVQVALPGIQLTDHYNVFTIPADTIRILKQAGLITAGRRRESTYSRLMRLSQGMSQRELILARQIVDRPEKTEVLIQDQDDKTAARVLDVAMEAFDYFHAAKVLSDEPTTMRQKNFILRSRARNPEAMSAVTGDHRNSPSDGHAASRWGLYGGYQAGQGSTYRLEYRAALHDLLDPPRGAVDAAQLEIGKLSFSYLQQGYASYRPVLAEALLVSVKNLPATNFWITPRSWELDLGVRQRLGLICSDCPQSVLAGSLGSSLHFNNRKVLTAFLFNGEINVHNSYQNNFRLGFGPKFLGRLIFNDYVVLGTELIYHLNTFSVTSPGQQQEISLLLESRWHINEKISLALQARGVDTNQALHQKIELGMQYFY